MISLYFDISDSRAVEERSARLRPRAAPDERPPTEALFVRIPAEHARRLDRAAFELRRPKQALVSELVERYVDPDSPASLAALAGDAPARGGVGYASSRAHARRRVTVETLEPDTLVVGHHSFRPAAPAALAPEVLTAEQAAELLQVEPSLPARLAEAGELPGRKLAGQWRFSREALLRWLAAPGKPQAAGAAKDDR
jgi:excisionase family DNA binding protein